MRKIIKETVREYDKDGKLIKETITETIEECRTSINGYNPYTTTTINTIETGKPYLTSDITYSKTEGEV